jgi:hypothetical protein
MGTGFDDPMCNNVASECNFNYYANPPSTFGALTCELCKQDFGTCAPGTYLPFCNQGKLPNPCRRLCLVMGEP